MRIDPYIKKPAKNPINPRDLNIVSTFSDKCRNTKISAPKVVVKTITDIILEYML